MKYRKLMIMVILAVVMAFAFLEVICILSHANVKMLKLLSKEFLFRMSVVYGLVGIIGTVILESDNGRRITVILYSALPYAIIFKDSLPIAFHKLVSTLSVFSCVFMFYILHRIAVLSDSENNLHFPIPFVTNRTISLSGITSFAMFDLAILTIKILIQSILAPHRMSIIRGPLHSRKMLSHLAEKLTGNAKSQMTLDHIGELGQKMIMFIVGSDNDTPWELKKSTADYEIYSKNCVESGIVTNRIGTYTTCRQYSIVVRLIQFIFINFNCFNISLFEYLNTLIPRQ